MTVIARPKVAFVLTALVASLAGLVVVASPAGAIAPFPISDPTNGTPGASDPNWTATANTAAANKYTSDGWLRLNDNGTSRQADLLNPTAFPASAGFEVDFDYRQAGGTPFADKNGTRTGDGLTMFLIDGTKGAAAGAVGNGLAYGAGSGVGACGMPGGYLGLGLDVFGNYAVGDKGNYGGFGGVGSTTALPNGVDLRGSGPGNCTGATNASYPWVNGTSLTSIGQGTVWTGVAGDRNDPATEAASLYRHVRIIVNPAGGNLQTTVYMSAATPKANAYGAITQVFTSNLSGVAGQVALPSTLKIGFGASSGGATDYKDIRNVAVSALTDLSVTKRLNNSTPGHAGLPAATFVPGDHIAFTVTGKNNGPTAIGAAPAGVARVYDNLSKLPITGVTWNCAAAGGAVCVTGNGTGNVVSEDWTGPVGSSVTLTVNGTISALAGKYTNTAVIPTNFTNNTVNPTSNTVQKDGGLVDTNLANNTASVNFSVVAPALDTVKTIKTVDGQPATAATTVMSGDVIVYSIVTKNTGTWAGNTVITDKVPLNTTYTGTGQGWSCASGAPGGSRCTQSIGVAIGATSTLLYTVTVVSPLNAGVVSIRNTATSSGGTCSACSVSNLKHETFVAH